VDGLDGGDQLRPAHTLEDVAFHPRGQCPGHADDIVKGREHDELAARFSFGNSDGGVDTAFGYADVDQQDVGLCFTYRRAGLGSGPPSATSKRSSQRVMVCTTASRKIG
jgi:hypothetical protein